MFQNLINKIKSDSSEDASNASNLPVNYYDEYEYIKIFRQQSFDKRLEISNKIINKHDNRIPIIVGCKSNIKIDKNKYIVPKDLTISQFLCVIKKRIDVLPTESIFLICNNKLMLHSDTLDVVYYKEKDSDKFLYICISLENTFGNHLK